MAEGEPKTQQVEGEEEEEQVHKYKPPAEAKIEELLNKDAEDESLQRYKQSLGISKDAAQIIIDDKNKYNAIVKKLALVVEGRPEMELDLTQKPEEIKKKTFVLKEGCQYKVKIYFQIQREIVAGLKYNQKVFRKGIRVDKGSIMVGSFAPKLDLQFCTTPLEDAPSGMLARGTYQITSCFTDDDKNDYLTWEWNLKIAKDWDASDAAE